VRLERVTETRSSRAVIVLPLALSRGPARLTVEGATNASLEEVSPMLKKRPPDWASGPALNVEFASWSRGAVVVLASRAPWLMEKPEQHDESLPRLVVLKLLELMAEKRGPASVTVLGAPTEVERRRTRMPPAESMLVLAKERSGRSLVLVSVALSPMKMKLSVLAVGSPIVRVVALVLSSGPARVMEGGSPRVDDSPRKLFWAVTEPPVILIRGSSVVLLRVARSTMPTALSVVVKVESCDSSSGPWRLRLAGELLEPDRLRSRLAVVVLVNGSVPPRLMVLFVT